jgi:adenylate kinase family enzyme
MGKNFECIIAKDSEIENKRFLFALASGLAQQRKNIVIFGLPFSGKTRLAKAIKDKSQEKTVIDEWMDSEHSKAIRKQKNLVVTHQFPAADRESTEEEIKEFLLKQGLLPEEWVVVLIRKN